MHLKVRMHAPVVTRGLLAILGVLVVGACHAAAPPLNTPDAPATLPDLTRPVASPPNANAPTKGSELQAVVAARARIEVARPAPEQRPRWDHHTHGCITDGKTPCRSSPSPLLRRSPTAEEAALLRAYDDYLVSCRAAAVQPDAEILVEWSDLNLSLGDIQHLFTTELHMLASERYDPAHSARAALLLLHGLYAGSGDRESSLSLSARPLLSVVIEDIVERPLWTENSPEAEEIRRVLPQLRIWVYRQSRATVCDKHIDCIYSEALAKMLGAEHPETPQFMLEGALGRRARGEVDRALELLSQHLALYPKHATAQDVRLALAETHEGILDLESARDDYAQFVEHGRGDPRLPGARGRWVTLAFVTKKLPEATIEALLDGDAGARELAIAVRFRALSASDATLANTMQFIHRFGPSGGNLRLGLAHLIAARMSLLESCPTRGDNLCVELVPGQMLGRVLPRESRSLVRARAHLGTAETLLKAAAPPSAQFGPPLDIEAVELAHARLELAFLKGDLGAESALAKRPPVSFEATRTREWLARRSSEVESMTATYDGALAAVPTELHDRYIARSSARKAQVYEADTSLLETVLLAFRAGDTDSSLVISLRDLASSRRRQAFEDYRRCLKAIAAWGRDADQIGDLCRAGVGRLTRRQDDLMEYTKIPIPG